MLLMAIEEPRISLVDVVRVALAALVAQVE
jgi:hypothetical protein